MTRGKTFGSILGALLALLGAWYANNRPKPEQPLPSPTPTATATAEPTPAPTIFPSPSPAATPTPTPEPPESAQCAPPSPGPGTCVYDPEECEYRRAVESAQSQAEKTGYLTPGGRVKDEALYTNEVARLLRLAGYCAINGSAATHTSEDEVWLKAGMDGNRFSQHYDIIRGDGVPITLCAAKCVPARF